MAVGNIWQVKLTGEYLGQETLNVFYYQQNTAGGGNAAENLSNAFQSTVLDALADLVVDNMHFEKVETMNGSDNTQAWTDFSPTPDQGNRDVATQGLAPSNLAYGFRSNRNGGGTRYSYKRFAGVAGVDIDGNGWAGGVAAVAAAMATALGQGIGSGGDGFLPVQIGGGFKIGVVPTLNFPIEFYEFMTPPSTQNTRRQGRGA